MPNKKEIMELKLNMKYKQIKPELFVGQCREFPFVIVKGKSVEGLKEAVFRHLEIYFNTYPAKGKEILSTFGTKIEDTASELKNEIENEKQWQEIAIST
ncbi:MAG: hypothetical protein ACRD6Q_03025 [Nitrososphaeraceae archaeon]